MSNPPQKAICSTRNKSKKAPNEKSSVLWKPILLDNDFFKIRLHMAHQADPQSGKCSYIDPLSFILSAKTRFRRSNKWLLPGVLISTPVSHKHTPFSFGAFLDLFLVEHEWPQQGPTNEWPQGPGPTGPNEPLSPINIYIYIYIYIYILILILLICLSSSGIWVIISTWNMGSYLDLKYG